MEKKNSPVFKSSIQFEKYYTENKGYILHNIYLAHHFLSSELAALMPLESSTVFILSLPPLYLFFFLIFFLLFLPTQLLPSHSPANPDSLLMFRKNTSITTMLPKSIFTVGG